MRPHMAHINNTLIRKRLAENAAERTGSYLKYRSLADKALSEGYAPALILGELEAELKRVEEDAREGDAIFQKGVENAKASCADAIKRVINELKGEHNG